jgi:uncharacterized protein
MSTETDNGAATGADAFAADWRAWHEQHEEARASRHGFLAVTSLRWLGPEPERFPDAPGAWHTGPRGVVVDLAAGESLVVEGRRVTGRHRFGPIPERGGTTAAFGDAVVEVARRGGADVLRPRHPDSPLLREYAGTPSYDPDPRWAVPARFEPYADPVDVPVGSVVEGLEHVYAAYGDLVLELDGREHRLVAFPGAVAGTLFVLFRDATSGVTTYPAVRSVSVPAPGPNGRVVVDLNRAVNLPCAYTPHATCPLPPAGNVLPVAVEAGERLPA